MADLTGALNSTKFTADIRKWIENTLAENNAIIRDVVVEVGDRLIDRTPKKTGRAKSNWNYAPEVPDIHTTEETEIRTVNGIEDIPENAAEFNHTLANSLPYATRLELGWSKQAPAGMVGLTAIEFPSILDEVARKVRNGR